MFYKLIGVDLVYHYLRVAITLWFILSWFSSYYGYYFIILDVACCLLTCIGVKFYGLFCDGFAGLVLFVYFFSICILSVFYQWD